MSAYIIFRGSTWDIRYQPDIDISNQMGTNANDATSLGTKGNLINQSNSLYTNDDESRNFANSLNIYHKFKKKDHYLSFNFYTQNQNTNGDDYNSYRNLYYDSSIASDSVNQYINNQVSYNYYSGYIGYTQPLSKIFSADIGYKLQWQSGLNNKRTYDFNDATGKYASLDSVYSNEFKSQIITQTPSIGLTLNGDSGRCTLSVRARFYAIGLHHYSVTRQLAFNQNQFFILPQLNFFRQFKSNARLGILYYNAIQQPDISQLLPVADNTNPLYIIKGNPNLKPSVYNELQFYFNHFDFKSGNAIFLRAGYHFTQNDIVNVTTYNQQLEQTTSYTNVNGDNGFSLNADISKTRKEASSYWQIKLVTNANLNNNHAFVNAVPYLSKSYNVELQPSLTYGYKDLFEFTPSYTLNYQWNKYDIKALNAQQSMVQQAGLSGSLYWPKRFTWTSDWTYTHNSDVAPGFRKGFVLWNGSIGIDLFKKSQATLQLSVYDLLNQNINVQRSISATYTQDTQTIILHRYFMLKFIYNLRRFEEKKKKKPVSPSLFL